MDNLEIETKPRSISFGDLDHALFPSSTKLVPLDLKRIRQERLLNKTSTPKADFFSKPNTLIEINTIQEELKHYKVTPKGKEESKLVFGKEVRPKSSLRGLDDALGLIRIAETASSLLRFRKNELEVVKEEAGKKMNATMSVYKMKTSATQRDLNKKGLMKISSKAVLSRKIVKK